MVSVECIRDGEHNVQYIQPWNHASTSTNGIGVVARVLAHFPVGNLTSIFPSITEGWMTKRNKQLKCGRQQGSNRNNGRGSGRHGDV